MARYYDARVSMWESVDPMADNAPGWTPAKLLNRQLEVLLMLVFSIAEAI